MPGGTDERYAAFLSYSQQGDGRAGPLLKAALERFPGPWYGGRRRQVYVDKGDLAVSPDLRESLRTALARSRHLLLVASPESAASPWVRWEVDWWLRERSPATIIILHARGRIDFAGGRLTHADALPPRLAAALRAEPNLVRLPALPASGRIDPTDSPWENALASVVATLDGVDKSTLIGDHLRNQRRWKRIRAGAFAALSVLLVLAIGASVLAFTELGEARRQQRVALARLLLNQAEGALGSDPRTALRMAEAAQHLDPGPENTVGLERLVRGTHYAGTLGGHTGYVAAVRFAPDGHALAAAGNDGNTILWDTRDITRPRRAGLPFSAQDQSISALAWAPSGTALATADLEGTVILWDVRALAEPRPVGTIENGKLVAAVAYAGEGILLCALRDTIKIWDVRNPAAPAPIGELPTPVQHITLSGDGTTLATVDPTGTVRTWNTGDPAHPTPVGDPLPGTGGASPAPALSADGRLLAVGAPDGTVVVRGLPRGPIRLGAATPDGSDPLSGLVFTPDGQTLVVAHQDGRLTEWDLASGASTADFRQPAGSAGEALAGLAMHPSGRVFATGGSSGDVLLWTGPDRAAPLPRGPGVTHPGGSLDSAAFTGHTLVTLSADDVRSWDLTDLDHPRGAAAPLAMPDHRLHDVVAAGDRLAFGTSTPSEGRAAVAELAGDGSARVLGTTDSPKGRVDAVALRPDGRALATGGGSTAVSLWDLADPARPRAVGTPMGGYSGLITAATFSADGGTLVAVSDGREYRGPGIRPPDADGRGSVILWDVADLAHPARLGAPLTGHDGKIRAVALSPDGHTLAYGGTAQRVYLWDLTDRARPHPIGRPLTGPAGTVSSIAFAPDGRTLAVGSGDDKVYLWDVSDLSRAVTPIAQPLVGRDGVASVAFAPDGSALASAGRDGSVVLWDLGALTTSRRDALAIACAATGGGLDEAEWASLVPGLAPEPTCPDADRDPLGLPAPTDVLRFGESAAVHRVVDVPTARQLLTDTFTAATSVTDAVVVDGTQVRGQVRVVPAHPVRRKTGSAAVDKTTGAVYDAPRIVVRDPRVEPTPTARPPSEYLTSGSRLGVQYVGTSDADHATIVMDVAPGTLVGDAQRTVDVYSVATYDRVADTTDVATVFHYDGSWTFGADPAGAVVLRGVEPPTAHPLPDHTVLVPR